MKVVMVLVAEGMGQPIVVGWKCQGMMSPKEEDSLPLEEEASPLKKNHL
jgi:hypothetical protein